jgi:hypothetical protein
MAQLARPDVQTTGQAAHLSKLIDRRVVVNRPKYSLDAPILYAAAQLARPDGHVIYADIARRLGVSRDNVIGVVKRLRAWGQWPYWSSAGRKAGEAGRLIPADCPDEPDPPADERAELERRIEAASAAKAPEPPPACERTGFGHAPAGLFPGPDQPATPALLCRRWAREWKRGRGEAAAAYLREIGRRPVAGD